MQVNTPAAVTSTARPLEGIRVIDMSHVIAGPMASFLLSHLGADVIKIEAPEGGDVWRASKRRQEEDGAAAGFTALNAGKRSLAIDIRQPEGAQVVRDLITTADVVIENFRPGVVARCGLDYESVREIRPAIIYCSISGFGQEGQLASRGGYDHVVQALTGMMLMGGESEDAPPQKVGFPVIDVGTGMLGALAVTAALARKGLQPQGQYIDVSMVQSALMLMYPPASNCLTFGEEVRRSGNRGFSGSPGADTYRCNDGWLAVGANTPQQFRRLSRMLNVEHLCEDPRAFDLVNFNAPGGGFVVPQDLPYIHQHLSEAFARQSAEELESRLNDIGVPAAKVRRLGEFMQEWQALGMAGGFKTYTQGPRVVRTPGPGFRFMDESQWPQLAGPDLGQDNSALLAEAGYSDDTVRYLVSQGILRPCGSPEPTATREHDAAQ